MTYGVFRSSDKFYKARPPSNCRSARLAWDQLITSGPILRMRLLDGYWGAERENGDWDDVENTFEINERRHRRFHTETMKHGHSTSTP